MLQFYAGELKMARATMRNPTQKAFDYEAAIIIGLPEVVRSEVSFSIPADEEIIISFPITMPSIAGIYPVHVQVTSGGQALDTIIFTLGVEMVQILPEGVVVWQTMF